MQVLERQAWLKWYLYNGLFLNVDLKSLYIYVFLVNYFINLHFNSIFELFHDLHKNWVLIVSGI